jgi:hypothetical protein
MPDFSAVRYFPASLTFTLTLVSTTGSIVIPLNSSTLFVDMDLEKQVPFLIDLPSHNLTSKTVRMKTKKLMNQNSFKFNCLYDNKNSSAKILYSNTEFSCEIDTPTVEKSIPIAFSVSNSMNEQLAYSINTQGNLDLFSEFSLF